MIKERMKLCRNNYHRKDEKVPAIDVLTNSKI